MLPSVTEVKVSVHRSLPQVSDFVGASTDVASLVDAVVGGVHFAAVVVAGYIIVVAVVYCSWCNIVAFQFI